MKWRNELALIRFGLMVALGAPLALVLVSSSALAFGIAGEQQAKLLAGDPGFGDQFGNAAAVSGETLVVGAPRNDDAGNDSGSAYVFVRSGTVWIQQAKLVASDASAEADFGRVVALDGDIAVIGAPQETPFIGNGSAYVFVRNGSVWTQQAKLTAGDGAVNDNFGLTVAVSGTTVMVGAPFHELNGAPGISHGAVYVFVQQGVSWEQQAKLTAFDAFDQTHFGQALALDEDTVAVGALDFTGTGLPGSSIYVLTRVGSDWSQQAKLGDPNRNFTDGFGTALSLDGDTLVAGLPGTDLTFNNSGTVEIFVRNGSSWSLQATVLADDPVLSAQLGASVSVSGDTLVAGAPGDDDAGAKSGSAYVFVRQGASWSLADKLVADDGMALDQVGFSVSVDGDIAALGGPTINGFEFSTGKAYVFVLEPTPWLDLGAGLAGTAGVPSLVGTGSLVGGQPVVLTLTGAATFSPATMVVGLSVLGLPFKGGTLVPFPDLLLPLQSDGLGSVTFGVSWPLGVPPQTAISFQYWIVDPGGPLGFSASNATTGLTP